MYVSCTFECGHSVSFSICYSVLCSNPSDVDVILFPVINEPYVPSQISRIIKSFFIGKNKWLVLISASITLFSFRSYGCLFLSLSLSVLRFFLCSIQYVPPPPLYLLLASTVHSWSFSLGFCYTQFVRIFALQFFSLDISLSISLWTWCLCFFPSYILVWYG